MANDPLKIAVIGLTHTHVHWIFESEKRGDIEIVGIVESNRALAERYGERHDYDMSIVYANHEALIESASFEAVAAFGSIYEHLEVVQTYAPLGKHIMVEKPLAVSLEHALEMDSLARANDIHLLTNYETTWYPSNHEVYQLVKNENRVGPIRKIVVRDGHKGPKKIGVNEEFLSWLVDPELNGGGAIIDFGCYGANLATWLMDGQRPKRVTAITQQQQPENNPLVDDEAIILLDYDTTVAVLQPSWNWPIGRKDMGVYGLDGVAYADNRNELRLRMATGYDTFDEQKLTLSLREPPYDDPFSFFAALVRRNIEMTQNDLSGLTNNLLVVEILEAAKESAEKGVAVTFK
ncbi:MAG: Gfo/Idh/MocA family oxidoreductase [Bacteroidota bacterium]